MDTKDRQIFIEGLLEILFTLVLAITMIYFLYTNNSAYLNTSNTNYVTLQYDSESLKTSKTKVPHKLITQSCYADVEHIDGECNTFILFIDSSTITDKVAEELINDLIKSLISHRESELFISSALSKDLKFILRDRSKPSYQSRTFLLHYEAISGYTSNSNLSNINFVQKLIY